MNGCVYRTAGLPDDPLAIQYLQPALRVTSQAPRCHSVLPRHRCLAPRPSKAPPPWPKGKRMPDVPVLQKGRACRRRVRSSRCSELRTPNFGWRLSGKSRTSRYYMDDSGHFQHPATSNQWAPESVVQSLAQRAPHESFDSPDQSLLTPMRERSRHLPVPVRYGSDSSSSRTIRYTDAA